MGRIGTTMKTAHDPSVLPIVIALRIVGASAVDRRKPDVWIMLLFGLVGFAMQLARFPLAPFVIGFFLVPMAGRSRTRQR